MDKFSAREKEVFGALEALSGSEFAVIGGYAVNAYALPRFSVDCDLVVPESSLQETGKKLLSIGFVRVPPPKHAAYADFSRFEKAALPGFVAAFDLLIGKVHDRQSGAMFSAEWVFSHSTVSLLPAKTFSGQLRTRIIGADALFVMKFCSARATDIRDIFMLCDKVRDWSFVKGELAARIDFASQHSKIMKKIAGPEYKKDLGGVFGYVEPAAFDKRLKIMANVDEK